MENKSLPGKVNETNSLSSEKINYIDKPLARLMQG